MIKEKSAKLDTMCPCVCDKCIHKSIALVSEGVHLKSCLILLKITIMKTMCQCSQKYASLFKSIGTNGCTDLYLYPDDTHTSGRHGRMP